MMDDTYAPRSPDLSALISSPTKQQFTSQPTNNPQSPIHSSYNLPSQSPRNPYPFQNSQQSQAHPFGGGTGFADYNNSQYQIPSLPASHSFSTTASSSNYYPPSTQSQSQPHFQSHYQQEIKTEDNYPSNTPTKDPTYRPPPTMASRGARQPRNNNQTLASSSAPPPTYKDPNPNNIEIKTKFPVARIKRIMQADEEVGKVAQVTPVAVSKALELFMIALVGGAAEKAKEKGGKRVTAQHLKQVVLGSPEQFDFLADIVARVSEAQEGAGGEGRKRKEKQEVSESDEEVKKPKKTKGRKKKNED
ncbi:hypothetical protein HYALB_00007855 [Hymenoscyphus albidus]|uniref:NCT transcriptional regulatory complex subunit A n=1 Tax=Hymenoscyphus albidus TaxID=595503 RepID=A0A9N9Q336_9HELO|nr:hypothetical protein HYALB_00007855 [Hymenoscyphus albidus]